MVLGFMKRFPGGDSTLFKEKILGLPGLHPKLHTIREGQRWKKGLFIHMAYGVRSKQYEQFNKNIVGLHVVKGVQRFDLIFRNPNTCLIFIDRKLMFARSFLKKPPPEKHGFNIVEYGGQWFQQFYKNDGFDNEVQFWAWFKKPIRNGQIIHWTDLKY